MGDLFGAIDFDWLVGRIAGEQPVPFLIWSAFAMAAGFAFGMWWRRREERSLIDDRLGKVPEFSRVRTLSDLMEKADELAQSASAEVMVERTQRIAELEAKVAQLAMELDAKRSENARLMELVESNGLDDAEALRDEVADLKRELMRANASIWNERRKEGAAMKQARGRLSKLTPPEAEAVRELYRHGPAASRRIDESIIEALKDKKAVVGCDGEGWCVRLSDQMVKDLNKHASIFEELFGR